MKGRGLNIKTTKYQFLVIQMSLNWVKKNQKATSGCQKLKTLFLMQPLISYSAPKPTIFLSILTDCVPFPITKYKVTSSKKESWSIIITYSNCRHDCLWITKFLWIDIINSYRISTSKVADFIVPQLFFVLPINSILPAINHIKYISISESHSQAQFTTIVTLNQSCGQTEQSKL